MNKKFLGLEQDLISVFEIWQGKRFISKNNQGITFSFLEPRVHFSRPKSKMLRLHVRRIFFFLFFSPLETVVASMQRLRGGAGSSEIFQ